MLFEMKNKKIVLLFALFLFAALIRCVSWYFEPELARDSVHYLALANGQTEESFRPPLFVETLRLIKIFGGDPHIGGVIVNIIAGSMVPVLIFLIAGELKFELRWRIVAAIIAAVHPRLVQCSIELLRESQYLFFTTLFILCVCAAARRANLWLWSAAGISAALAMLCRFEALELLPITLVIVACHWFVAKKTLIYNALVPCVFCFSLGATFITLMICCGVFPVMFWNAVLNYTSRF